MALDDEDHETRMAWFFNPQNTGLQRIDLDNHALVLFTPEFPTKMSQVRFVRIDEIFKSDLPHVVISISIIQSQDNNPIK